MIFGAAKNFARILFFGLITCALGHAVCPVNVVVVKGQVHHAPPNAKVRVELFYPKKQGADSAEMTLDNERFSIPVGFLTQSRRPLLVGSLGEKCDRKPETVVVTLVGSDPSQEYDRVSLDLKKDFKMADPTAYTLRSEIVLNGPQ
jgi:hypothetical protein